MAGDTVGGGVKILQWLHTPKGKFYLSREQKRFTELTYAKQKGILPKPQNEYSRLSISKSSVI